MNKLFVYGTLKKGYGNHVILGNSRFLGADTVYNYYTLADLGPYPAAIRSNAKANIVGEVYEIDDATFERCDRLEGYPDFYTRSIVETRYGEAWMYHFQPAIEPVRYSIVEEWKGRAA